MQDELKSFLYVDCSLRAKKDKLIDELNLKKYMQLKRLLKSKFFAGITNKQRKYIIHPQFMVANQKITDQFIQNLKGNPNKVHELTGEMKKSFKKHRLKTSIHPQIQKFSRINDSNGKTKYLGSTFTNNEVALEQCWIREKFEISEPDLYKQVKTVRCDETQHKTYSVPVGRCALHNSHNEPNFVDMHPNALICLGESCELCRAHRPTGTE